MDKKDNSKPAFSFAMPKACPAPPDTSVSSGDGTSSRNLFTLGLPHTSQPGESTPKTAEEKVKLLN